MVRIAVLVVALAGLAAADPAVRWTDLKGKPAARDLKLACAAPGVLRFEGATKAALSADGRWLFVVTGGVVERVDLAAKPAATPLFSVDGSVDTLAAAGDAVVVTTGQLAYLWRGGAARKVASSTGYAALDHDGKHLVWERQPGSFDSRHVEIVELATGKAVDSTEQPLRVATDGGKVALLDATAVTILGGPTLALDAHADEAATYAAFSPDGTRLAVATFSTKFYLFDLAKPRHPIAKELAGSTEHGPIAFSPDGARIVFDSFRELHVRDGNTGKPLWKQEVKDPKGGSLTLGRSNVFAGSETIRVVGANDSGWYVLSVKAADGSPSPLPGCTK